jgi:hypothetical protein
VRHFGRGDGEAIVQPGGLLHDQVSAEPKMVTSGPAVESDSNDSTNSAMIRKMRQGTWLMKPFGVLIMARA